MISLERSRKNGPRPPGGVLREAGLRAKQVGPGLASKALVSKGEPGLSGGPRRGPHRGYSGGGRRGGGNRAPLADDRCGGPQVARLASSRRCPSRDILTRWSGPFRCGGEKLLPQPGPM